MIYDKQVYTEVYSVLSQLPLEYTSKIPYEVKEEIFNNADTSYIYRVDTLLPQSKALLVEIIRSYFGNKEIENKLNEYISFQTKLEEQQKGHYDSKQIFKEEKVNEISNTLPSAASKKDNFFIRFLKKLGLFKNKEENNS